MLRTESYVSSAAQRRKVLVLRNEPSIQNLLALVTKLGRESTVYESGQLPLASIYRTQFDSVLLDLRCLSRQQPEGQAYKIHEIRPSLVGKVLVITAEVSSPKTLELVERYLADGLPRTLLWLLCRC